MLARQASDLIERTLAEEAVRESEERFRLIANTAPVMIWMSDAEKQITYLNQTWLDYTGLAIGCGGGIDGLRSFTPTKRSDAATCTKAFEQREPFQLEIGSAATTANIAG